MQAAVAEGQGLQAANPAAADEDPMSNRDCGILECFYVATEQDALSSSTGHRRCQSDRCCKAMHEAAATLL
jgi:hypothetical protein